MNATKAALAVLGVVLLLAGVVFALQGASMMGGSSFMNGDPRYIYVGALVAVIGVIVLLFASRSTQVPPPVTAPAPQPAP